MPPWRAILHSLCNITLSYQKPVSSTCQSIPRIKDKGSIVRRNTAPAAVAFAKAARRSPKRDSEPVTLLVVSAHLMKYVNLIQSIPYPDQRYVGTASDINAHLSKHNEGGSPHTSEHKL